LERTPLRQQAWLTAGMVIPPRVMTGRRDGAAYWKSTKCIFGTNTVLSIRDAIMKGVYTSLHIHYRTFILRERRRGREDFIDNQPVPLASLRGKCSETSSVFMMIPFIAPLTL
jgi:hypothetical protein